MLSFFDGTLYEAVQPIKLVPTPQIVTFLTCNSTSRLDPAFLRKGRVDLCVECNHVCVGQTPKG